MVTYPYEQSLIVFSDTYAQTCIRFILCLSYLHLVQSLVAEDSFQHILRVLNTNVDGKQKIVYAMTAIKGLGRRFSNVVCKKAEVDLTKR